MLVEQDQEAMVAFMVAWSGELHDFGGIYLPRLNNMTQPDLSKPALIQLAETSLFLLNKGWPNLAELS